MGRVEFEGRAYDFKWESFAILGIVGPLLSLAIYYSNDYVWLHEITAKITVWSLNLLTGLDNQVVWAASSTDIGYPKYSNFEPGWFIIIEGKETGPIRFTTFCTGIQAIAIFIGVTITIPQSTIAETNVDIWPRKIKAMIACSFLFYVVNVMRMWLQLYLYYQGFDWEDVHYPISAASSFIAIAAILLLNKYVPEFIMGFIWVGDEVRAFIRKSRERFEGELKQEDKVNEKSADSEIPDINEKLQDVKE
jgi:exosortase/archaeosortase family protein